jgi:co-chaperonin GroES (HSP10)
MVCKDCGNEEGYLAEAVKARKIPFYCTTCGALNFRLQALGDKVFVWPDPVEVRAGSVIVLPEFFKDRHHSAYGTVLSIGNGCVNKKRRFIPTTVPVGTYVVYDTGVPWYQDELGVDGKMHRVKIMGELDIKGIVNQ